MLSVIIAALLGILAGVGTGLSPGLHVNLVAAFLLSTGVRESFPLAVFLVALAVSHAFHDFIPSTFFGVPSSETAVSALPAHKLTLQGRGYDAVFLLSVGALASLVLAVVGSPLLIVMLPLVYSFIKPFTFWLVLGVCVFLVLRDRHPLSAFIILLLSGILGIVVLRVLIVQEPFLPLLSGLYGIPGALTMMSSSSIPSQWKSGVRISPLRAVQGCILGLFTGFLPGIGSAQAASLSRVKSGEEFLVVNGGLNTSSIVMTLLTAGVLGRVRSGVTSAVVELTKLTTGKLSVLIIVVLLSGIVSFFTTLVIARWVALHIRTVSTGMLALIIVGIALLLVAIVAGLQGVGVLFIASSIGLLALHFDCSRSHAMGCIIVPVLVSLW